MNKLYPHLQISNKLPSVHQQGFHLFAVYTHKLCLSRTATEPKLREDDYALNLHLFKAHAPFWMLFYSHLLSFISYSLVFYLSFGKPLNPYSNYPPLCSSYSTIWWKIVALFAYSAHPWFSCFSFVMPCTLSRITAFFTPRLCLFSYPSRSISVVSFYPFSHLHLSSALLFMCLSAVFCETHIRADYRIPCSFP